MRAELASIGRLTHAGMVLHATVSRNYKHYPAQTALRRILRLLAAAVAEAALLAAKGEVASFVSVKILARGESDIFAYSGRYRHPYH